MSKAWPIAPIRAAYRGLFDGPHATPKPSDEGPVFLGIGNITEDGHLDLAQTKRISEDEFPRWTKRVLPQPGDIVFTYEATLNRYAIVPNGFRGCLGRRLALIRPNPAAVNTRWLHYYFFGPEWRAVVAANTLSGATVERIPLSSFPAAEQMFRRMVFNVMARNCDDHTKNFSFRMKKDGKWELAPAYDLCHAYQPGHRWVSQHALSINGKRDEITRGDLLTVAKSINCKNATEIIEQIRETVNRWDVYARSVGVSATLRKSIDKTLIKSI